MMEKILLIIAVLLTAVGAAVSVVNLVLSRKNRGGAQSSSLEIDELNNNLNEVKNIITEHVTKEKDGAVQSISGVVTAVNNTLSVMINNNMQNFKNSVDGSINTTEANLEKIRQELKTATDDMRKSTAESMEYLKRDTARQLENMQSSLSNLIQSQMNNFGNSIEKMNVTLGESLDKMNSGLKTSLKEVRDDNRSHLDRMNDNNAQQLEMMRQTVDEKLTATLNDRISNAFAVVSQSLESVNKGFGEMKELTGQVGNLNKMFSNIKTRGNWGEVELESILDNILSPDQYKRQFKIGKSAELVDFAVVMPGQSGEELYLPIDAKFPSDRYVELVNASDSGDMARIDAARKELVAQIKKEAISIKQKYVKPPKTTPFAIMFLPSEGLYAEVIKDSVLTNVLQNEHKITVCGPTTVAALLSSLQMGFMTLKIQKNSNDIAKALQQFQKDFQKYTGLVSRIKSNADDIVKTVGKVEERNDIISKRLGKVVGNLPQYGESGDIVIEGDNAKLIASDIDGTDE